MAYKTFDFVQFCENYGIPYIEQGHHHCHEGWIQTHCPFCSSGSGWHLGFSIDYGVFNCWRCGRHSLYAFLSEISLTQALSGSFRDIISKYEVLPRKLPVEKSRVAEAKKPSGMSTTLTNAHKQYLLARDFHPSRLKRDWRIGFTTHAADGWDWRVIAPITDWNGRPVAYLGRAITSKAHKRWIMSKKDDIPVDPRTLIYGIEHVNDTVLIVEGPSDVWRIGKGAVATLGVDWRPEQANILRRFNKRFIMFDPEPLAQKRAKELANWLAAFDGETEIITGLPCDPGDLPQHEANKIRQEIGLDTR